MTLPKCNPIDFGWFAKGAAIDHVGTQNHHCKVCESSIVHEKFFIRVGSAVGIGAPFFAKPFMKHSSTKGKLGGSTGHVIQCTSCNSLWAFDEDGVRALAKGGLPAELIAPDRANEYRNRSAKIAEELEADLTSDEKPSGTTSRIQKTYE